jgi:hypothetical protein
MMFLERNREIYHQGSMAAPRTNADQPTSQEEISLSVFTATPVKQEPDRASIKWPKPARLKYPKIFRGAGPKAIALRDRIHVEVAQEVGLNLRKCSICGVEKQHGHFDVHHINGDHNDNRPENLIALCRFCHINVTHGYYVAEFPSDSDDVFVEETNGIVEED